MIALRSLSRFLPLLALSSIFHTASAATSQRYVEAVDASGNTVYLLDDRKPSLYTGDFGDCMGGSLVNVTRFDAAYYKDNMTVSFHLTGDTALKNEALMMYIGVYAYGENRFDLTFNPCSANINSLCPMKAGVPIEANGLIPVAQSDVANIPAIALSIPDFEGEAILRIFANSTQTQIGCFSAIVTNGATFSQPAAVGSVLGIFTIIAVIASFATAIYGDNIPVMRKHYAHSLSVMVVFAVFHHIFFTGALSMNWPSVLVAFWSNYAWAGGMIYSKSMQTTINNFIGNNRGNTSAVGAATSADNSVGSDYDIHKIYGRGLSHIFGRDLDGISVSNLMKRAKYNQVAKSLEYRLAKRTLVNSTNGFSWYGNPVGDGLPLPGNFSGFAGTLGQEKIPASNAFLTGFLWLLILVVIIAASVVAFKFTLEAFSRIKFIRQDRLTFFRAHWLGYTGFAILRTLYVAFFMMMFLTMFQFTYNGAPGMIALAVIVFLIFFVGMLGVCAYACFYRIKFGNYVSEPDRINLERRKVLGVIPWYRFSRASEHHNETEKVYAGSLPFWRVGSVNPENTKSIHDDEDYTKKFGWLASRFRRSRWWFFSVWLVYEFIRACFYAGASGHPLTQVFGLLVVEIIAFIAIVILKPFEGQRLNAIVVYCLGFSKVTSVALSAAFDIRFNLARIPTTVVGVIIIVIQGILTIILLIAIAVGAATSWMSVKRDREDFRPRKWAGLRTKYFTHLQYADSGTRPPPPPEPVVPEIPKDPYFSVSSVRRVAKIEDEDEEFMNEIRNDPRGSVISLGRMSMREPQANDVAREASSSQVALPRTRMSRAASINSTMSATNLPYGARPHRASWSSRDLAEWSAGQRRTGTSSTAPILAADGRPVSGNLSLNTHFMTSRDSLPRMPSPYVSRPPSVIGEKGDSAPINRPKSRSPSEVLSPQPSTMSPLSMRPTLSTLPSEDHIEKAQPTETSLL